MSYLHTFSNKNSFPTHRKLGSMDSCAGHVKSRKSILSTRKLIYMDKWYKRQKRYGLGKVLMSQKAKSDREVVLSRAYQKQEKAPTC